MDEQIKEFGQLSSSSVGSRILLILTMIVSGCYLYISPRKAWEPTIIPDEVEYCAAGYRLATMGSYTMTINGKSYPTRYPPGFSALVLAPIYRLFPGDLGNGIWGVLAFAMIAAGAAFDLGRRLAGDWGGVAAATALIHWKDFEEHSRIILSDVPVAALGLCGAAIYLRMRKNDRIATYAVGGLIAAVACAIRPLAGFILLPFAVMALRRGRSRVASLAVVLIPWLVVVLFGSYYNLRTFGHWSRTGYQYWQSIPFDYPTVVFSASNLKMNLAILWMYKFIPLILILAVIGWAILRKAKTPELSDFLRYTALAAGPVSFVHLWYAYSNVRFHFIGLSLLVVVAAAGLSRLIPAVVTRRRWLLPAALAASLFLPPSLRAGEPKRRELGEAIERLTPLDAVIVTAISAPYLDTLIQLHGAHRTVIPPDRDWSNGVYNNLVICVEPSRLHSIPETDADQRAALLSHGGYYAHDITAAEGMDTLGAWVADGRAVYVDFLTIDRQSAVGRSLQARFQLKQVDGAIPLFRLMPGQ
jgi:hypothetical protein